MGIISRLKLDHPALGTAGGAALHTAIEALFTKIGDMTNSRYFISDNLNNAASVDLEHNYKSAFSELKIVLYGHNEGTGELTRLVSGGSPNLDSFAIIATPSFETTKIRITNNTGSQQDIATIIVQGDFAESLGELDDVNLSTPATDKQALLFNTATSRFIPASVLTPAGSEVVTNKDVDGGTASTTVGNVRRITMPKNTSANIAGLTRKEASVVFDTTIKKLVVDDGSVVKAVGGGLVPVPIDKDYAIPLVSGKHYLLDASGALSDITLNVEAGADESNIRVTVVKIPLGRKVIVDANGTEKILYNNIDHLTVEFLYSEHEAWAEFVWNGTKWLVNDNSNVLSGTFSGALTLTGLVTASVGVNLGDTTLTKYLVGTHTSNWQGAFAEANLVHKYTVIGNMVYFTIPAHYESATSASVLSLTTNLPVAIRPAEAVVCLYKSVENGAGAVGQFRVATSGAVEFYPTVTGASFTNGALCGTEFAQVISWSLA